MYADDGRSSETTGSPSPVGHRGRSLRSLGRLLDRPEDDDDDEDEDDDELSRWRQLKVRQRTRAHTEFTLTAICWTIVHGGACSSDYSPSFRSSLLLWFVFVPVPLVEKNALKRESAETAVALIQLFLW